MQFGIFVNCHKLSYTEQTGCGFDLLLRSITINAKFTLWVVNPTVRDFYSAVEPPPSTPHTFQDLVCYSHSGRYNPQFIRNEKNAHTHYGLYVTL